MRIAGVFILATLAASAWSAEDAAPESAKTSRFDGVWSVTVVCADYKDAGVGAKGYTLRMLGEVKNGQFEGQKGKPGEAGSLRYSGRIQPDGSGEFRASGSTGNPEYTPGRLVTATPYSYRLAVQFDERRGSGKRLDTRPCEATFVKQ
jgi:hypothetical protein